MPNCKRKTYSNSSSSKSSRPCPYRYSEEHPEAYQAFINTFCYYCDGDGFIVSSHYETIFDAVTGEPEGEEEIQHHDLCEMCDEIDEVLTMLTWGKEWSIEGWILGEKEWSIEGWILLFQRLRRIIKS
jgi:hypothetical protein